MTREEKFKLVSERHTLSLMLSYIVALFGAFLVLAFV